MAKEPRLPLNVALRRYWRYMLGLALFPSIAFPAVELFHVPFPFVLPIFFAVTLLAAWPYYRKQAPYAFWLVALGVWMAAGFLGILVLQLLRLLVGPPTA
jgi:hypothetical protein